jgi:hypothetical protein
MSRATQGSKQLFTQKALFPGFDGRLQCINSTQIEIDDGRL